MHALHNFLLLLLQIFYGCDLTTVYNLLSTFVLEQLNLYNSTSPSPMLFLNLYISLLLRVSLQQGASKQQKDGGDAKH